VVTVIGITFVGLLGASVLVESVFALPGLGSGLTTAASQAAQSPVRRLGA